MNLKAFFRPKKYRKEPEPATKEQVDQLKLEVQKAKLESDLNKYKQGSGKGSVLGRLWQGLIADNAEKRKARRSLFK